MQLAKTVTNRYIEGHDFYKWHKDDLGEILKTPGTYQVFYFAKDTKSKRVSKMMEFCVYKASSANRPPVSFSLQSPKNGVKITSCGVLATCSNLTPDCYTMMTWEYASDPDNDLISYTMFIKKNNEDFEASKNLILIEKLRYNFCSMKLPDWDGATVYWKVQAIDKYGAIGESNINNFIIDNTNNVPTATIFGHVYESANKPIENAKVFVGDSLILTDIKGKYSESFDPNFYDISVRKKGYHTIKRSKVNILIDGTEENFKLVPIKSFSVDLNNNGIIDMFDLIIALKILTELEVNDFSYELPMSRKIHMEELLFIFRSLSK